MVGRRGGRGCAWDFRCKRGVVRCKRGVVREVFVAVRCKRGVMGGLFAQTEKPRVSRGRSNEYGPDERGVTVEKARREQK